MSAKASTINDGIAALLPRLRRVARVIVLHRDAADDLVQIAVQRALARSAQWDANTRLDSWIFSIMRNVWNDELRLRKRRDQVFAPDEAGEHAGDESADARRQRLTVQKAVCMLSEEHRMVVALVLVDGMPYKEAASVLGIPLGTLTGRLTRARVALQEILSDQKRTAI
ncbi:MAG TPA: RNA polymerase sigma factor [Duganella sp.]|jgi:RNA polymerase sigma-70 factor (ECF subfamily)